MNIFLQGQHGALGCLVGKEEGARWTVSIGNLQRSSTLPQDQLRKPHQIRIRVSSDLHFRKTSQQQCGWRKHAWKLLWWSKQKMMPHELSRKDALAKCALDYPAASPLPDCMTPYAAEDPRKVSVCVLSISHTQSASSEHALSKSDWSVFLLPTIPRIPFLSPQASSGSS